MDSFHCISQMPSLYSYEVDPIKVHVGQINYPNIVDDKIHTYMFSLVYTQDSWWSDFAIRGISHRTWAVKTSL